ncbi:MAG: type IV secretion system DNA-binding domain-containing protein [Patescibacteria group bacterium]
MADFSPETFYMSLGQLIFWIIFFGGIYFTFKLFAAAYSKRRKRFWLVKQKYTTLLIQVPRNNEKGPQSAQFFFASLHGIYKNAKERLQEGSFQEHISFEIVSIAKYIRFYIHVPEHLKDFIEGQLYAQYPNVEIKQVEDYTLTKRPDGLHFAGTELVLSKKDYYPINTFQNFEVDPLAGITGVLAQVEDGEQIWAQVLARPIGDSWQKGAFAHISQLKSGKKFAISGNGLIPKAFSFLVILLKALFTPPTDSKAAPPKLPGPVEQAIKAIEEKSTKLGYEIVIRIMFLSKKEPEAMKLKLQSIAGAFKQFNASNLNGFAYKGISLDDPEFLNSFQTRNFEKKGFILNIEELASVYHLPTVSVETPSIVWAGSKKGEPPATLPIEGVVGPDILTVFGRTNFRGETVKFGMKLNDRRRHMYIVGQTGTGKSTMIENMAIDDIREGRGLAILDPHGSLIDNIMKYIPDHRIDDVVIFNPGDKEHSVGFNLLESINDEQREIVASGIMSIFKKIWENVWSARMEYIMKNIILALMETPGSTFLGATKMLINKDYRKYIVDNVTDPLVKEYWVDEFEGQVKNNAKFITEAVAPIQNKIGQFLAVPSVRSIVGQGKSTIDIKDIMDNKKIFLIKISKGEIGEDNMRLLGAMIITKIQLTAMARAGIPEDQLSDFFLYVDEFQNFATSSFADILSEARKYRLSLIIAHQFMAQMTDDIREAVVGNVGTAIAFRVGANDPPLLVRLFAPVFDESDLVNLSNYHIYVKLLVDGQVNLPFSATTLAREERQETNNVEKIIALSRSKYTKPRSEVEQDILTWSTSMSDVKNTPKVGNGEMGETIAVAADGTIEVIPAKPKIAYRELKDKKGGIWYLRKKKDAAGEGEEVQNTIPPEKNATQQEVTDANENIQEVEIAPHEVAEREIHDDLKDLDFGSKKDTGEIKIGQEIEL